MVVEHIEPLLVEVRALCTRIFSLESLRLIEKTTMQYLYSSLNLALAMSACLESQLESFYAMEA